MRAALSVPVQLAIGDIEVDLGAVDVPLNLTTGKPGPDPHGGAQLPISIDVDMPAFRRGLAAQLREAATRIEYGAPGGTE